TPCSKAGSAASATRTASRVLPMPPAPTRDTERVFRTIRRRSATSRSRPMGAADKGRLWWGSDMASFTLGRPRQGDAAGRGGGLCRPSRQVFHGVRAVFADWPVPAGADGTSLVGGGERLPGLRDLLPRVTGVAGRPGRPRAGGGGRPPERRPRCRGRGERPAGA